jgi:ribosome-associated protein
MFTVDSRIQIPDDELRFTYARSSGPGGQNVNKVNSKAILRWNVAASPALGDEARQRLVAGQRRRIAANGDLVIASERYRDQARNAADCLDKLRAMILAAVAIPKKRRKTRPTKASRQRRRQSKQEQAAKKQGRQTPTWD